MHWEELQEMLFWEPIAHYPYDQLENMKIIICNIGELNE